MSPTESIRTLPTKTEPAVIPPVTSRLFVSIPVESTDVFSIVNTFEVIPVESTDVFSIVNALEVIPIAFIVVSFKIFNCLFTSHASGSEA